MGKGEGDRGRTLIKAKLLDHQPASGRAAAQPVEAGGEAGEVEGGGGGVGWESVGAGGAAQGIN